MKTLAVIPARLASTRLPRKMLREIAGKPMVVRVYEAVRACPRLDDVTVATDSDEIVQVCRQHGCKAQMTSGSHRSGTERVHEISKLIPADVYLNVRGDEPLTRPEMARLTMTRKTAITLTIWKKGLSFDAKKLHRRGARASLVAGLSISGIL